MNNKYHYLPDIEVEWTKNGKKIFFSFSKIILGHIMNIVRLQNCKVMLGYVKLIKNESTKKT